MLTTWIGTSYVACTKLHNKNTSCAHSEGEDDVDVPLLPFSKLPIECHPLLHRLPIEKVLWEFKVGPRHTVIKGQITL